LLYETSRYVDIYKIYNEIAEDRKLEPEERKEQKYYQRLADVFTPLLKLFSSEYSNQLAYDAIQIHGGAGFMKDFPVERLYRDARITSIYEGTSQLQVVAAIRGVTTKGYLNRIKELDELKNEPEQDHLKKTLREMTADYEKAFEAVNAHGQNEYLDFHARRLVEMAGNIIMGYLLIADSQRDEEYKQSAELFVRKAAAENKQKSSFLMNFDIKDLGQYKVK
jgi:hypothetical protein